MQAASKRQDDASGRCDIAGIAALASLSADTLDDLQQICRHRVFGAGQVVSEAGERSDFIGVVARGVLRMEKTTTRNGRQHIVGLLVEGDMFGRVFDGPLEYSIEAATDAVVFAFHRTRFEALVSRTPELERVVMLNILNELDRARDWMLVLSNAKVRTRLAGFLMMLCTRFAEVGHILSTTGGSLRVNVPINRADLASLLGTRPESISRAFHALSDEGSIVLIQPDLIQIRDLEALAEEAGEDFPEFGRSLKRLVRELRDTSG